jgi:integrase
MLRGRALAAGIDTTIGNHTFRAAGNTAYLKNSGTLENAVAIASHTSTRTTQLYDRRLTLALLRASRRLAVKVVVEQVRIRLA